MSPNLTGKKYFGFGLPYIDTSDLTGKLIVIEGTDGVGRSTQIEDIKKWLEVQGHAVMTTGWTRSAFIGQALEEAKSGHNLNVNTFSLFYAAEFADRLEHEIIPALRAGFIVLADRYIYTAFVRSIVRGADPNWIRGNFGFAIEPDAIFYMKIAAEDLIPRVINSDTLQERYWEKGAGEGMDYWESGMDMHLGEDFYDSFVEYQKRILTQFEKLAKEYKFHIVDASKGFQVVNKALKDGISALLETEN